MSPGSVLSSGARHRPQGSVLAVALQGVFLRLSAGVRHFAALQLTGVGDEAKGSVRLFPLNGKLGWGGG